MVKPLVNKCADVLLAVSSEMNAIKLYNEKR